MRGYFSGLIKMTGITVANATAAAAPETNTPAGTPLATQGETTTAPLQVEESTTIVSPAAAATRDKPPPEQTKQRIPTTTPTPPRQSPKT
ncbi:MAG: hypothetical protein GY757_02510, partial [bacterium]|nr:hypothetical protein [bacterium]